MPLVLTCSGCGRELTLDDAFSGASCRCRECRTLMLVPESKESTRRDPTDRPEQPPVEKKPRSEPTRAKSPTRRSSGAPCKRSWLARNQRRLGVALGGVALILIGWSWVGLGPRAEVADPNESMDGSVVQSDVEQEPVSYFGVPLRGSKICYVVDSDESMAEYIDKIMLHASATNYNIKPGTWRMGVIQAVGTEAGETQLHMTPPSGNLRMAAARIKTKRPRGETDLSIAMTAAAEWDADQILLILSKDADPAELEALRQAALNSGATVDVIAFGAAIQLDLSPIAQAGKGLVARITDEELHRIIEEDATIITSLQKWR